MTIKVEKADTPRREGRSARMAGDPDIMDTMVRPLDLLLCFEEDLLRAVEPEAMRWLARRQEDVRAGLHTLGRLSTSTDASARLDAQRDWLNGAIGRLQADLATLSCRWALPAAAMTGREDAPGREMRTAKSAPADEGITTAA